MRQNGLRALHRHRTRRVSVTKPSVLIPNVLQRQFTVTLPNKAWVTDIAYVRTWQVWLHLAVLMAARRRRPRRTLIHSDQGTQ
jgi:putative transposase